MASKQITDHQKSSVFVRSSLTEHEERVVKAFVDTFGEGGGAPQLSKALHLVLAAVEARLAADTTATVAADDALAAELGDDKALLEARDEAYATVHDKVVGLRATLSTMFGESALSSLGLAGQTPSDAAMLVRVGAALAANLPEARLGRPRLAGMSFDAKAVAKDLAPDVKELDRAVSAVTRDQRENQAALMERDRAWDRSRQTFAGAANFASALFSLAGLPELARRVRPTGRNPGTVADDGPAPAPTPAATGTDPQPA